MQTGGAKEDRSPTPGSGRADSLAPDELLWIWDETKVNQFNQMRSNPTDDVNIRGPGNTNVSIQGNRAATSEMNVITPEQVEIVRRLRSQRNNEINASNKASSDQTRLTNSSATGAATIPNSTNAVEQSMYTEFLGV